MMSVLRRRVAGSTPIALTWPVPDAASVTILVPERVVSGPLHAPPLTVNVLLPFSEYWNGLPLMPLAVAAQTSIVPVVVGVGPGGIPSEPAFVKVTTVRVDSVEPAGAPTIACAFGRSELMARYDGWTSTAIVAVSGETSSTAIGPGLITIAPLQRPPFRVNGAPPFSENCIGLPPMSLVAARQTSMLPPVSRASAGGAGANAAPADAPLAPAPPPPPRERFPQRGF